MKLHYIFIGIVLLLSGCFKTVTPSNIVLYNPTIKPLDLSAYKNIPVMVDDKNVCLQKQNYNNILDLLTTLSNYIDYQKTIINSYNDYYKNIK